MMCLYLLIFLSLFQLASAQNAEAPVDPLGGGTPESSQPAQEANSQGALPEATPLEDPAAVLAVPLTSPNLNLVPNLPSTAFGNDTFSSTQENEMTLDLAPVGAASVNRNANGEARFILPIGYGISSITFPTAPNRFASRPFRLRSSVQIGYDDNIYSSSGREGQTRVIPERTQLQTIGPAQVAVVIPRTVVDENAFQPRQGSLVSVASVGGDFAISNPRSFFYVNANVGGTLTWEAEDSPFAPTGDLGLYFSHEFSERMTLSGLMSNVASSQLSNGSSTSSTRDASGGYLTSTGNISLSYRWSSRVTFISSLLLNSQRFFDSSGSDGSFMEPGLAQAVQYAWSRRLIFTLEARVSTALFGDSNDNRRTEYLLGGVDYRFSERLTSSLRAGAAFQQYSLEGASDASSPTGEINFFYNLPGRVVLAWINRYGFELTSSAQQQQTTARSGLTFSKAFTERLSGSMGVTFAHSEIQAFDGDSDTSENSLDVSLGLQYTLNRRVTLFGNYTRSQVFADDPNSYDRNQIFFGATFLF